MNTTSFGCGSFFHKIRKRTERSVRVQYGGVRSWVCDIWRRKTVIVTPELKLFLWTFTGKGLPHSEFKSRLDGHRRPISGPARAGLRPFLRPIPGINYCSLSGRSVPLGLGTGVFAIAQGTMHRSHSLDTALTLLCGRRTGARWPVDGARSINTPSRDFKQHVSQSTEKIPINFTNCLWNL